MIICRFKLWQKNVLSIYSVEYTVITVSMLMIYSVE